MRGARRALANVHIDPQGMVRRVMFADEFFGDFDSPFRRGQFPLKR